MTGNFSLVFVVFWPILAAFISYFIGRKSKRGRDYFANFATIVEFLIFVVLAYSTSNEAPLSFDWQGFAGFRLYLKLDGFRCIYGLIAALMWMMTTLFSREYFHHYHNRNRYYFFMLLTFGGTVGTFLSADLTTTFIFFELMSFASYVMVIHDEKPDAQKAAGTYMAVAVLGGLVMLMGIFLTNHYLGTTQIDLLHEAAEHVENKSVLYLAASLMLFGFGGKAGMFPMHIWLPNAHPVAPAPASALLSGVLTKTGIFGIIVISVGLFYLDPVWGMVILILGVITMFLGAFLAVFSINLKRTLACSSMSQIGFILVGVGMIGILGEHNALAVRGTLLHMVNHSLIKLVLFIVAGIVYMNLHELDLNKIRGFGRGKPIFVFAFAMGVLGIIGMPMWNGYISKTLLHESIVEQIWLYADYTPEARFFQVVESIFTLTGGLTAAYMTKVFVAVCLERNVYDQAKLSKLNGKYMHRTSAWVIFICALILPVLGMFPNVNHIMMDGIGKFGQYFMHGHDPAHEVHFLAWANLRGAVASLSIGAIVYFFIVRGCLMAKDEEGRSVYINAWPRAIDIEQKIYKPLIMNILPFIGAFIARIIGSFVTVVSSLGYKAFDAIRTFWIENTGKGVMPRTLQEARDAWEEQTAKPLYPMAKVREDYEALMTGVVSSAASHAADEGKSMIAAIDRAIEWAEDCVADDALGEKPFVPGEEAPDDAMQGIRPKLIKLFNSIKSYVGSPEKRGSILDWGMNLLSRGKGQNAVFANEFVKTIVNSLLYSLLLFLVGLVAVLLFVVLR